MGEITQLFGDTKQELRDRLDKAEQCIVISFCDGELMLNASPDLEIAEIYMTLHKLAMAVMAESED